MRLATIATLVAMLTACSHNNSNPLQPTATPAPAGSSGSGTSTPLSELVGVWTGHETATHGESGDLTVVFEHNPTPGANVHASITWTSDKSHLTYEAQVEGTLDHLNINSHPDYVCVYKASGALINPSRIEGTYSAVGADPCPRKAGSFYLDRQ